MFADLNGPSAGTAETAEPQANGNTEAAHRRRQLRAVEAERDVLRTRVQTLQRAEIERTVGTRLVSPADLWLTTDPAALLTDGEIDPELVARAVDTAVKDRPHWARPAPDFDAGVRGSFSADPPGFGAAVKQGR